MDCSTVAGKFTYIAEYTILILFLIVRARKSAKERYWAAEGWSEVTWYLVETLFILCWSRTKHISYKNKEHVLCGMETLVPFNEKWAKEPEFLVRPNSTADGPETFNQTTAISLLSLFSCPSVSSLFLLPFISCSFLSVSAAPQFPDNRGQAHTIVLLAPCAARDTSTVTLATFNASNSILWTLSQERLNYQGMIRWRASFNYFVK